MTGYKISQRLARIQESASIAIADRARTLQARGRRIINLAAGEPDFPTPLPIKIAAVEALFADLTKYTKVDGTDELKAAIAAKLSRDNGIDYPLDCISVSNGGKQAIFNALLALLDPGDEVIVPAPYWVSYPEMVQLAGGVPVIVPTTMAAGFKLTAAGLAETLGERTALLILNSPANPTGAVYSYAELRSLATVLERHPRVIVISDDIYEYIRWSDEVFHNLASVCPELRDRVLLVNGLSKSHAMTGWRIGYCAGPAPLIAAMRSVQSHSTSNPNSIAQHAAVRALQLGRDSLKSMIEAFRARHDYVIGRLNAISGVCCLPAEGAFYAFPDVRELLRSLRVADDTALAQKLLDEAGVAVVPGTAYGAPGHLRLSFATSMAQLKAALDAFELLAHGSCASRMQRADESS